MHLRIISWKIIINGLYFLLSGELELPEELPEFPYEAEFIREIENAILQYGGKIHNSDYI